MRCYWGRGRGGGVTEHRIQDHVIKEDVCRKIQADIREYDNTCSKLQIRGVIGDNSKIIFLFLKENISCYPSLEPSR